jgi:hypothetical protein
MAKSILRDSVQKSVSPNPPPERGRPRLAPYGPEWGGVGDTQRQFGIKETHLYQLMKEGRIKSVLVKGRGKTRGKRLVSFSSVRALLASLQTKEDAAK